VRICAYEISRKHVLKADLTYDQSQPSPVAPSQFRWTKGSCVSADTPTLKSIEVKWRFSKKKILCLIHCNEECLYSPRARQLMFIILMIDRYDTHRYCGRWAMTKSLWAAPQWALLNGPEEDFLQLFGLLNINIIKFHRD
jgi:hypothetical protein